MSFVSSGSSESGKAAEVHEVREQHGGKQAVEEHVEMREDGAGRLEPPRVGFWHAEMAQLRVTILRTLVVNSVLLGLLCFTILLVYWGASYDRAGNLHRVSILAVVQDGSVAGGADVAAGGGSSGSADAQPLAALAYALAGNASAAVGTWHVYSQQQFMQKHAVANASLVDAAVLGAVHHEDYWLALNIKPNASQALVQALQNGSADFFDSTQYFDVYYESGRDPTSIKSTFVPLMQRFEAYYRAAYIDSVLPSLATNDTNAEVLIKSSNFAFNYIDYRPFNDAVVLSPLQVGAIYVLILTVCQFALWGQVHAQVSQKLKIPQLVVYRITVSMATLFFLSLFFCTISAVFQVDFTKAFGRGGFVIYWMSTWLIMTSLAGANENVLGLVIAYGQQYMAFWLISWIILNISPSFFPLILNSRFYRFGYAMPIHNAVDIYKVIFLDLSKHKLGRNYGILVAWVALNYSLLPIFMKFTGEKMRKNAIQQTNAILKLAKEQGKI